MTNEISGQNEPDQGCEECRRRAEDEEWHDELNAGAGALEVLDKHIRARAMEALRAETIAGLDPSEAGAAYGYVLGRLLPVLAATEEGRAAWESAWSSYNPTKSEAGR